MAKSTGGLSRLLSAEIEPQVPLEVQDKFVKKFLKDYQTYIRRLFAKFTGQNIYQTIYQENPAFALPPVPDKTKTYVVIWNCSTQKVEWRFDGIDCGVDVTPDTVDVEVSGDSLIFDKDSSEMYHDESAAGIAYKSAGIWKLEYYDGLGHTLYYTGTSSLLGTYTYTSNSWGGSPGDYYAYFTSTATVS
jgi:hypothetical protein